MIFIGIIGEYLGHVYIETKKRPVYLIKEEVKILNKNNKINIYNFKSIYL